MSTRRSTSKKKPSKKPPEYSFSSDDEKPTQERRTRQAYRSFNGTQEQERVMLLTALRTELSSKTTKFIKSTLQQHQRNRIIRTIQDEDTDFEKLSAQASRAFSITWIKQTAPGKLQYKPQILSKYAKNAKSITTKDVNKPTASQQILNKESSSSESESENLLASSDDEEEQATEDTPTPLRTNVSTLEQTPKQTPLLTQPESPEDLDQEEIETSQNLEETPDDLVDEANQDQENQDQDDSSKTKTTDHEDSSFSYTSITREIEQVNRTIEETTTTNWKQEFEDKMKRKLKTSITQANEELQETLNTTKGEILTHFDTLRADIKQQATTMEKQTKNAEQVFQKLQKQQKEMESLSHNLQLQQTTLQEFLTTLQTTAKKERHEIQTIREEARKNYKWDMEQASRNYLVQHEKKSEVIMTNARTRQSEDFRKACKELQKEYKKRIERKYDELEAESMQFADQAILDLGDLLHQEKNNILGEVTQELPDTIIANITQEITTQLETTTEIHTEAITAAIQTQHKAATAQLQETTKRHTDQLEAKQSYRMTTMQQSIDKMLDEQMETHKSKLQTKMQEGIETMTERHMSDTTAVIDAIKAEATITFSLELQAQVQQQLNDIQPNTVPNNPYPQERKDPVPLTSKYWAETMNHTTSPARPSSNIPVTPPTDRFKLARSKELESKLPHFRKDQMFIHLPDEPLQHYMEAFYETLATMMNNYDFPIVLLQDLAPRGTTCPREAYNTYERETLMKISRALYQKLLGVIPHTCTIMHNLLANHAATQDGYKALYAMMRLKCTYLQDLLPTWGPTWQTDNTAFEYVSSIHSYLTQERRRNKYYTEFEVAAEMVQQAKRHPAYQLLAGAYMAQIIAMPTDQKEMSPEFHTDNLALNFESNKQTMNLPNNPTLNKFGQPRNEGSNDRDNGGRRRPQYKNPVQCTSCKLFGHCIETQVCRFSAQLMYAKEYIEEHGSRAKSNAEAYNAANNRNKVNKIYQQFPEKFDDYMTEEERENARYEMATTFYCKSADDQDEDP
jgi:hypothetical protein